MRKSCFFLIILLSFAKLTNAQYQIKIKAINTLDTVVYFRGTVLVFIIVQENLEKYPRLSLANECHNWQAI